MQWFRMWADAVDDEKLRLLAFEDRWHFVALLCLKRSGLIDEPPSDLRSQKICVKLGLDSRELETVMKRLVTVGLINESLHPLAWKKRQFESDSSTSRVRAFRKRRRNNGETFQKRPQTQTQTQTQTTDSEKKVPTEPVELKLDRGAVERVFDHWRSEHKHPKSVLDSKRRRAIQAALKTHDEPTLCQAISGYRNSPHHMGENDQRTVYDDISLFLRDATHVEAGLRFARGPPPAAESQYDKFMRNLNGQPNSTVIEHDSGFPAISRD